MNHDPSGELGAVSGQLAELSFRVTQMAPDKCGCWDLVHLAMGSIVRAYMLVAKTLQTGKSHLIRSGFHAAVGHLQARAQDCHFRLVEQQQKHAVN